MNWGGPEFIIAIIAIGTLGGVIKTAIRARHGFDDPRPHGSKRRARQGEVSGQDAEALAALKLENRQLREKLELHENRLISLERIVTDPGYDVARQIEALRHDPGTPLAMPTRTQETVR